MQKICFISSIIMLSYKTIFEIKHLITLWVFWWRIITNNVLEKKKKGKKYSHYSKYNTYITLSKVQEENMFFANNLCWTKPTLNLVSLLLLSSFPIIGIFFYSWTCQSYKMFYPNSMLFSLRTWSTWSERTIQNMGSRSGSTKLQLLFHLRTEHDPK